MKDTLWRKVKIIIILSIFMVSGYKIECSAFNGVNFRNITVEEGLSQATIETMIQDKKGYIWLGTNDGLNRYNGYDFTVFSHEKDKPNSIVNNYIVDLEEDLKGNIWVGTINGVSKISDGGVKITNYLAEEGQGNLSHYNIGDILILKDGSILVGTIGGLNLYDESTDSFRPILEGKLSSEAIYSLDEDSEGNIWVGTESGLNVISSEFNEIKTYYHDGTENSIPDDVVYKVFCDKDDTIWIGTYASGASKINVKTGEITHYIGEAWGLDDIPGEHIRNFYRDSNDILWISSSGGLIRYDDKDEFQIFKNKIYDRRSLVDDSIFVVMEDKSGMLWVGTYAGISIFDPTKKIIHYKNDPFDKTSISDNMVQGIYEDEEGYLWIGTNSKGVNILDKDRNSIATVSIENNNFISSNRVNDIEGYKNLIFLGTNNGLNIIDKNTNTIKVYKEVQGLASKNIKNLFVDDKNYLWIGTSDGFCILNIETNEIININYIWENVKNQEFYSGAIFQDSEGIYWLGNFVDGGLTQINPHTNEVINYKYNKNKVNSIIENSIRAIAEDNSGNIWIGTSGGLSMFNKKTKKFKNYTTDNGLPNNTIYGILIDEENNPWVSTNSGISCYDVSKNKFINLNIADGLQSNEFNGESYLKTKSGEFFFGGINGMNSFYPKDINTNDYVGEVVFDEFAVNGIKVNNIDGKRYDYDNNNISIKVFLSEYKNSKDIRYYYMLRGADNEWRGMDTTSILFSNLSPGKYTFRVIAINGKGITSKENEVSFRINMPPWISLPSIVLYVVLIGYIITVQKNKVKRLDDLVEVRTEELRSEMKKNNNLFEKVINLERNKNSYLINLSHELRTPLNVLCSTEQLITTLNRNGEIEKSKLDYYMSIIRRNNTRLLNLVNNLIDISKIEHGNYYLNKKEVDIVYLVEEAALSLKEYIEEKGINFIIDPQVEEKIIKCDPQDIERCVINLISNAAKFTPNGGEITVLLEDLDDKVKIIVRDTGIGINPEFHDSIFDRFNQVIDANAEAKGGSGLGLTITKQIINLHHGHIYLESEVGVGTSFTIELPII